MDTEPRAHRSPIRILAPLALILFAVALVLVISSAGKSSSSGTSSNSAQEQRDLGTTTTARHSSRSSGRKTSDKLPQSVYIVKSGDTLGGIAQTTGIPVVRLQELNPGLDQFSLVAGQRIKLR